LFISNFTNILGVIDCVKRKTVLLAGDYNIDFFKCDSHWLTVDFLEILLSHSYIPAIKFPTRVTDHSATLIDNILTNSLPDRVDSVINYNDISDHNLIAIHLSETLAKLDYPVSNKFRTYNAKSIDKFNISLLN